VEHHQEYWRRLHENIQAIPKVLGESSHRDHSHMDADWIYKSLGRHQPALSWEGGGYSLLFCPRNANKSLGTPGRQDEKAETSRGIPRLTPRRHYMPRHGHMLPGAVQGRCSVAAASTLGDEWSISISLGLHKLSGSYAHLKHASTRPHNFQYHLHSTEAPSSGFSTSHLSNAGSDL
jgi:hypothetical protein